MGTVLQALQGFTPLVPLSPEGLGLLPDLPMASKRKLQKAVSATLRIFIRKVNGGFVQNKTSG